MIEIKEGFYYYGMFFIQVPPIPDSDGMQHGSDIMGCLYRDEKTPTQWKLIFRFRYYSGPNSGVFDSDDRKNWYSVIIRGEEDDVVRDVVTTFKSLSHLGADFLGVPSLDLDWLVVKGDHEKTIQKMQSGEKDWIHCRPAKPEEQADENAAQKASDPNPNE